MPLHTATTSSSSAERSATSDELLSDADDDTDGGAVNPLLESGVLTFGQSRLGLALATLGFGGSALADPVNNAKKSRSNFLKHISVQIATILLYVAEAGPGFGILLPDGGVGEERPRRGQVSHDAE